MSKNQPKRNKANSATPPNNNNKQESGGSSSSSQQQQQQQYQYSHLISPLALSSTPQTPSHSLDNRSSSMTAEPFMLAPNNIINNNNNNNHHNNHNKKSNGGNESFSPTNNNNTNNKSMSGGSNNPNNPMDSLFFSDAWKMIGPVPLSGTAPPTHLCPTIASVGNFMSLWTKMKVDQLPDHTSLSFLRSSSKKLPLTPTDRPKLGLVQAVFSVTSNNNNKGKNANKTNGEKQHQQVVTRVQIWTDLVLSILGNEEFHPFANDIFAIRLSVVPPASIFTQGNNPFASSSSSSSTHQSNNNNSPLCRLELFTHFSAAPTYSVSHCCSALSELLKGFFDEYDGNSNNGGDQTTTTTPTNNNFKLHGKPSGGPFALPDFTHLEQAPLPQLPPAKAIFLNGDNEEIQEYGGDNNNSNSNKNNNNNNKHRATPQREVSRSSSTVHFTADENLLPPLAHQSSNGNNNTSQMNNNNSNNNNHSNSNLFASSLVTAENSSGDIVDEEGIDTDSTRARAISVNSATNDSPSNASVSSRQTGKNNNNNINNVSSSSKTTRKKPGSAGGDSNSTFQNSTGSPPDDPSEVLRCSSEAVSDGANLDRVLQVVFPLKVEYDELISKVLLKHHQSNKIINNTNNNTGKKQKQQQQQSNNSNKNDDNTKTLKDAISARRKDETPLQLLKSTLSKSVCPCRVHAGTLEELPKKIEDEISLKKIIVGEENNNNNNNNNNDSAMMKEKVQNLHRTLVSENEMMQNYISQESEKQIALLLESAHALPPFSELTKSKRETARKKHAFGMVKKFFECIDVTAFSSTFLLIADLLAGTTETSLHQKFIEDAKSITSSKCKTYIHFSRNAQECCDVLAKTIPLIKDLISLLKKDLEETEKGSLNSNNIISQQQQHQQNNNDDDDQQEQEEEESSSNLLQVDSVPIQEHANNKNDEEESWNEDLAVSPATNATSSQSNSAISSLNLRGSAAAKSNNNNNNSQPPAGSSLRRGAKQKTTSSNSSSSPVAKVKLSGALRSASQASRDGELPPLTPAEGGLSTATAKEEEETTTEVVAEEQKKEAAAVEEEVSETNQHHEEESLKSESLSSTTNNINNSSKKQQKNQQQQQNQKNNNNNNNNGKKNKNNKNQQQQKNQQDQNQQQTQQQQQKSSNSSNNTATTAKHDSLDSNASTNSNPTNSAQTTNKKTSKAASDAAKTEYYGKSVFEWILVSLIVVAAVGAVILFVTSPDDTTGLIGEDEEDDILIIPGGASSSSVQNSNNNNPSSSSSSGVGQSHPASALGSRKSSEWFGASDPSIVRQQQKQKQQDKEEGSSSEQKQKPASSSQNSKTINSNHQHGTGAFFGEDD